MFGEVEIVEVDIEGMFAGIRIDAALLLEIIEQEIGLADSSSAFDGNQSVVPIDFVHQHSSRGHLHVLYEIIMCLVKCV